MTAFLAKFAQVRPDDVTPIDGEPTKRPEGTQANVKDRRSEIDDLFKSQFDDFKSFQSQKHNPDLQDATQEPPFMKREGRFWAGIAGPLLFAKFYPWRTEGLRFNVQRVAVVYTLQKLMNKGARMPIREDLTYAKCQPELQNQLVQVNPQKGDIQDLGSRMNEQHMYQNTHSLPQLSMESIRDLNLQHPKENIEWNGDFHQQNMPQLECNLEDSNHGPQLRGGM